MTAENIKYEKIQYQDIILYSESKDTTIVKKFIIQLDNDIQDFQKSVGYYLDIPVNVIIAPDSKSYENWTKHHSAIMEFSSGFYNRGNRTIYLRNPKYLRNVSNIRKILLHEYIHHFVGAFWNDPPLWFNEGMAVYFSHDMRIERELNFAKNYILGNSRKLEQMKYTYPKNMIEWESFYAKSGLAVKYLYLKKRDSFYRLWDKAESSKDFDSAFLNSFFMTAKTFSDLFENYSRSHFRMEILMASTGLIWGILPLILIVGVIRKKIKNKKIVEYWESNIDIVPEEINNKKELEEE
ncbi:MAG: hypothetical protein P9L97_00055 [Candidatus Tenebribacter davisii]|nr:hypothetical protein [Candidatus Tenebribacter davisii]